MKNLKQHLRLEPRRRDNGDVALLAWKVLANLVGVIIVAAIASMIPEMVRYLKLKNM